MAEYSRATQNSVITSERECFYVGRELPDGYLELYGSSTFPVRISHKFSGEPQRFYSYERALETEIELNREIQTGEPVWIVYLNRIDAFFPGKSDPKLK